ncbi:MAG TPA: HEAT repeat domain-containing protein, partial [Candidatus Deferrimicrobiaceae bacterium]|nr:HEAT repeat domain-containing protein [Candidatus Deferrimicrobiaceae bacterium]
IWKIISMIEEIPPPEIGLEIEVTKNALLFQGEPFPAGNKAVADLNRELYHRRASKIIFLPNQKSGEMIAFLQTLNRDALEIQEQGGLERVLLGEKVSRIWVNRVDYEGLTEILKKEEEEVPPPEEMEKLKSTDLSFDSEDRPMEEMPIEELLDRLEKETDTAGYRNLVILLSRALFQEREERRIEYSGRALSIYVVHIENPPMGDPEIAKLAGMGIKELVTDDLVAHYIRRLRDRGGRGRKEVETVLVAFGDRAVKPLIVAMAEEEDLLVRKAIVDIIVKIGRPGIPTMLDNMNDSRWYVVRNLVTILGSLGIEDLAPHVATALAHPDLRVKKEAIKALSKLAHPSAVTSLGEMCFFPEETVALMATAAMAQKKEEEAVLALYRRVVQKSVFYPHYRLAHEAIESLRSIDTDKAVGALEEILRFRAIWETSRLRELKRHALRSISKMSGERPKQIVLRAKSDPNAYLRVEAERILKKTGW